MDRPSYLLLIVLFFFAALVAGPALPSGRSSGESSADRPGRGELVVLQMGGVPSKGSVELTGRVIDVVGWPLAGAEVTSGKTGVATTDADGRFRLPVAENESTHLKVATRGGREGRAASVLPDEDAVVLVADLPFPGSDADPESRDSAEGSSLSGEGLVEDEDGDAVAHAVVTVVETGASVRTDEHGRYRIALPPPPSASPSPGEGSAFHLIARDKAGRVVRAKVDHTRQQRGLRPLPTLRVTTGRKVTGFLRDGLGNPAEGAGVVLRGQGQVRRVVTGGDGGFAIRGLLAGEYQLATLPHKGWVGCDRQLCVGGETQDIELRLRPERPLTILVEDQAGEPQADVYLLARETGYRSAHGRTDARGRVILRGLGDGKLTFTASRGPGQKLEILRYEADEQRLVVAVDR